MTSAERIVEYLSGELSEEDARRFEEALFEGAHDGADLDALAAMLVDLRYAAYLGLLGLTVSRAEVERLRSEGYRIVEFRLEPDQLVDADLSEEFDLLLVELVVDLEGVTRLDAEVCDMAGRPFKRVREIPFRPEQRSVMGYCAREMALAAARELPDGTLTRLLAVGDDGETERVVGQYRTRMTVAR